MDRASQEALDRLLKLAQGDSGQCRRVANFLLAWWNAPELGGFDLADLFAVDSSIAADMSTVFAYLARQPNAVYPEDRKADIERILVRWRPEIMAEAVS